MSLQQAFWVGAGILVLLFAAMAFVEFWIDRLWSRAHHSQAKAHTGRWKRRRDGSILPGAFGTGSRRPFGWYLKRKTQVRVRSVSELCSWLKACRYVPDRTLVTADDH